MRAPIDLTAAGPDWEDWSLAPYGRATSYRLTTPTGESLTAGEIAVARENDIDRSYLLSQSRMLDAQLEDVRRELTPAEVAAVRLVIDLLAKRLPPLQLQRRRLRAFTTPRLVSR